MNRTTIALVLALSPLAVAAQDMTLKQIMADPDWLGTPPEDAYWSADATAVYFEKERVGGLGSDLWRLPLDGEAERIEPAALPDHPADGVFDRARERRAFVRYGDLYVQDLASGEVRQLTRTAAGYADPVFIAGGRVAARLGNAIHAVDLASGTLAQLAEIRFEKDPGAEGDDETYLAAQQRRLLAVVRERQDDRAEDRARRDREIDLDPGRPPRPWYFGDKRRLVDAALAPDGRWLLVVTAPSDDNGARRDTVPYFVTDDAYVENRPVRAKVTVGEERPHAVALLDLASGTRIDLDLSVLPGIDDDPLARLRKAQDVKPLDGPRGVAAMGITWNREGTRAALMFRAIDNKDRWIATVGTTEHELVPRHRLSDEAWINWYTGREYYWFNDFGWLHDGATLWFQSEQSGYGHLYTLGPRARRARALTSGEHEVSMPTLSPDGTHFYYVANAEHPGVHEVYRVAVESGRSERLTQLGGRTRYTLSPDGSRLLLTSSSLLHHDELFVQDARPGADARRLTQTMSERFLSYPWIAPTTVAVPSSHARGRTVSSRVFLPRDYDPQRAEPYPVVMFVHGAGYLQNVHMGWSGYFREFMFHTYLAERGYVVFEMDYRASAGYGRDWRTAIYRRMGTPELEDFQDGMAWLAQQYRVDPARAGVYGGSYGGFMVFMALFQEPDLFAAGAALRPVSDWAHYHHGYTANILNTPELDPEAYARSSPIEHAEGLADPLLILSPMVDTNVLFKDVVRLTQRLIELEKTEWFSNAIYPMENHAFVEPSSWLDEYTRIFLLFEEHLTAGPDAGN